MKTVVTSSIKKAAKYILAGEPVGFPTETVYGLAANVFDEGAIEKIFKIKNRPIDNPLIVHISNLNQISQLAKKITISAEIVIERFFPGPVTIVLKKNEIIPDTVSAGLDTIAIRMPELELSRNFIQECGVPLAAPSANLSGKPSPTKWQHVYNDLNGLVSCILKGPKSNVGIESTVIDCTVNKPRLLRPGKISLQELRNIFPDITFSNSDKFRIHHSPGMKYRHYSPTGKVFLIDEPSEIPADLVKKYYKEMAYIGITDVKYRIKKNILSGEEEYSHYLFNFFRDCDKKNIKFIYCQKVKEEGIGLALMNRLIKAARD